MKEVKVGMVGCGGFGNVHLNNLLTIDGVKVVALATANKEKLESTGRKVNGARLYTSHLEMFEAEKDLDAVFVTVPPDSHQDIEILAAKKGIHLYIEKPIGLSLDRAKEIEECIHKAGIITAVGFQERYNSVIECAKSDIANSKTGLANAWWMIDMPQVAWWRRKERSGGQVIEQTIHFFDMFRYFFGEAKSVYSSALTGLMSDVPDYNIEDASSTTITFKNGVVATVFTACYLDKIKNYNALGFRVVCKDKILELDWGNELRKIGVNSTERIPVTGNPHLISVQTFINAVKTGDAGMIRSPYSDAVKTLELVMAADLSMRTNKVIEL